MEYDILKGSTVVGSASLVDPDDQDHPNTLRIVQLVGAKACRDASVDYDLIVDDCHIDWTRLDHDRVLDSQMWALEPK